jgi:hypothetical protein
MNPLAAFIFLLLLTASDVHGQAKTNTAHNSPSGKKQTSTSLTEKLLKFFGISDSPSTLKGPEDEVTSGELWIVDLTSKSSHVLASGEGYRSPVFLAGSKDVLVLRGNDVVRIPFAGGEGKRLYSMDGIVKLVGSSSEEPGSGKSGRVLVLLRRQSGGHQRVALLTVRTGAVTVVPYDPASSQDLQMVESLQGWSRTYGDQHLYMKRQSKQALSGTVEWSDVFLQAGNQQPVDVSQCDGAQCGQPSLSEDGRVVVFVKAKAE